MSSPVAAASQLAVVTVTYHPDLEVLAAQLSQLPAAARVMIVDNASPPVLREGLRTLCDAHANCTLLENASNAGLPAAINQGVRAALLEVQAPQYLLFLDQDTEPGCGGAEALLQAYLDLSAAGHNPGCVGPRLVDARSRLEHGFHHMAGWRWLRSYPGTGDPPVECANLNCSGTLLATSLFRRLGGLDEAFFIDHLDTEWAFRVLAAGYRLYGIPGVAFEHCMGEATWRIWLGRWRVWPYRSPQRHYFVFRNGIWLMRRSYVPRVWKLWAVAKLLLTAMVHACADPRRGEQLRQMWRGMRDGLCSAAPRPQ